ncbi:hypothetical protein OV090_41920 [Nannocystis sp. RBIL2]|uniref:hypothetical protein n=1 Tax=Nannocystis sp. RBIL2 TaxID=2996788 RepID=UPI0022722CA2|nr:hypothetical protein [Nannocystis sp. RBIL2]MCY1071375.1 hypothetical protein [Nannocystis sp. RBIL2]
MVSIQRISGTYCEILPAGDARAPHELRLDIDGDCPQMAASGTLRRPFAEDVYWLAHPLARVDDRTWRGPVVLSEPTTVGYDAVELRRVDGPDDDASLVDLTLLRAGQIVAEHRHVRRGAAFVAVEFELDYVAGVEPVLGIRTHAHPHRPASLPDEELTLVGAFARAGVEVTTTSGDGLVPLKGAGADELWSDGELHDAMQTYWSRFADRPQWALWVFFAGLHRDGDGLGGIMFDDIGPNHRQGAAIFHDSFISRAPAGDPNPAAWVQRMRFWTTVHEIGHAFNLAHSWEKQLTGYPLPWLPVANDPRARSWMNYPYNIEPTGERFFSDFEFAFAADELLFVRHAPRRFVRMGDASWYDNHGFSRLLPAPGLELSLHVGNSRLEFLEPVVLDVRLRNAGPEPVTLPAALLRSLDSLSVVHKRIGRQARRHIPFATYCGDESEVTLAPGQSITEALYVSAGRNGFDISAPGRYCLQAAVLLKGDTAVVSPPLELRIAPPLSREQEIVAQDYFSEDVARVMAFDGSTVLTRANDTLREIAEMEASRAAIHAKIALAMPQVHPWQTIDFTRRALMKHNVDPEPASDVLHELLIDRAREAVRSLSSTDYRRYGDFLQKIRDADLTKASLPITPRINQALREYGIAGVQSLAEKGGPA